MCAYRKVRRVNSGQRRPVRRQSDSYYDESEYPEHHHYQRRPQAQNYRMQSQSNNTPIIVISIVVGILLIGIIVFALSGKDKKEIKETPVADTTDKVKDAEPKKANIINETEINQNSEISDRSNDNTSINNTTKKDIANSSKSKTVKDYLNILHNNRYLDKKHFNDCASKKDAEIVYGYNVQECEEVYNCSVGKLLKGNVYKKILVEQIGEPSKIERSNEEKLTKSVSRTEHWYYYCEDGGVMFTFNAIQGNDSNDTYLAILVVNFILKNNKNVTSKEKNERTIVQLAEILDKAGIINQDLFYRNYKMGKDTHYSTAADLFTAQSGELTGNLVKDNNTVKKELLNKLIGNPTRSAYLSDREFQNLEYYLDDGRIVITVMPFNWDDNTVYYTITDIWFYVKK